MACYSPLRGYVGPVREVGKVNVVFRLSASLRGAELNLPCGKCVGCLMSRSRAWAVRCMHEASLYDSNCFITLTYDNVHLPKDGSLDVSDFQCFMKRLRKRYGDGIRFFHCGEYGSKLGRPHFHALLFNHAFADRVPFKQTGSGSTIYTSGELQELWKNGFSSVGDVTMESAAYVARYVVKKAESLAPGPVDRQVSVDRRRPEYVTMSRRPGLGRRWFDEFRDDVYPSDEVVLLGGRKVRPPRYYDDIFARLNGDAFEKVKAARKERMCKDLRENDSFRLPVKEEVFRAGISTLKRDLEA